MLPFSEPRVVFPFRSMASPASMLTPSPAFRLPEVRYWAAVASLCTASREMSLLVFPLAETRSLKAPSDSTFTELLKKLEDIRLVLEVYEAYLLLNPTSLLMMLR